MADFQVIEIIASHPDHDIIIGIDSLGKEDLLLQISQRLNIKVWTLRLWDVLFSIITGLGKLCLKESGNASYFARIDKFYMGASLYMPLLFVIRRLD